MKMKIWFSWQLTQVAAEGKWGVENPKKGEFLPYHPRHFFVLNFKILMNSKEIIQLTQKYDFKAMTRQETKIHNFAFIFYTL